MLVVVVPWTVVVVVAIVAFAVVVVVVVAVVVAVVVVVAAVVVVVVLEEPARLSSSMSGASPKSSSSSPYPMSGASPKSSSLALGLAVVIVLACTASTRKLEAVSSTTSNVPSVASTTAVLIFLGRAKQREESKEGKRPHPSLVFCVQANNNNNDATNFLFWKRQICLCGENPFLALLFTTYRHWRLCQVKIDLSSLAGFPPAKNTQTHTTTHNSIFLLFVRCL